MQRINPVLKLIRRDFTTGKDVMQDGLMLSAPMRLPGVRVEHPVWAEFSYPEMRESDVLTATGDT
jgi:hypothetical protein